MAEPVNLCSTCGQDNLPDSQFCGRCGEALLPPAPGQPESAGPTQQAAPAVVTPFPTEDLEATAVVEYAGFWLRFQAVMVDGLAVVALSLFVGLIVGVVWNSSKGIGSLGEQAAVVGVLVLLAIWGVWPLYSWLLTGLRGQTLGKIGLGIRVMRREGGRPGMGRSALRELVGKALLVLLVVGPFWLLTAAVIIFLVFGTDLVDLPEELVDEIPAPLWLIFLTVTRI